MRALLEESQYADDEEESLRGIEFLLKWLQETWYETGKGVIGQIVIFYALTLVGFLFLYFMMRSTTQLREFRKNVAAVIKEQKNRKFDLDDYRTMHMSGMF